MLLVKKSTLPDWHLPAQSQQSNPRTWHGIRPQPATETPEHH